MKRKIQSTPLWLVVISVPFILLGLIFALLIAIGEKLAEVFEEENK